MSAGAKKNQLGTEESEFGREDVVPELTLPDDWEVVENSEDDGILLTRNRNQDRWQSISFSISHRKGGAKILARFQKAPYRRDRVGKAPVERETLDSWEGAVEWANNRLQ